MELVSKLTPKTLGWDRVKLGSETKELSNDGRALIGRFVGVVSGLRQTINDDTGEVQNGLKGNFRGVSSLNKFVPKMDGDKPVRDDKDKIVMIDTGEKLTVTSGVCYLPSGLQDMIEGALASAKETDAKATVNFAIDLYGIPATNKAGYSFVADNIVEANATDPLQQLLERAAEIKLAALPAPTPEMAQGVEPEKVVTKDK